MLLLPDGQVSVQDQFSPGYGVPSIDLHQNVQGIKKNKNKNKKICIFSDVSTRSSDGLWSVNFSRPLATGDTAQDVDLRQCQHFLFLHSANPLVPGSGQLRKHVETPVISESRARNNFFPISNLFNFVFIFSDLPWQMWPKDDHRRAIWQPRRFGVPSNNSGGKTRDYRIHHNEGSASVNENNNSEFHFHNGGGNHGHFGAGNF